MSIQLNSETNFYDDYGIAHVPFWRTNWFWWTSIITLIIISALLLYIIGKKIYIWYIKKNLTPWAQALQELKALERQQEMGVNAAYMYTELIHIIKRYLQKRFSINLEHQTPQEMLDIIASLTIQKDIQKKLHKLFIDASVVLFAPEEQITNVDEYITLCKSCIQETIPQEKS